MNKDFLTVDELAERWGINKWTLYRLNKKGEGVPAFLVGRMLRYRIADVIKHEQGITASKED